MCTALLPFPANLSGIIRQKVRKLCLLVQKEETKKRKRNFRLNMKILTASLIAMYCEPCIDQNITMDYGYVPPSNFPPKSTLGTPLWLDRMVGWLAREGGGRLLNVPLGWFLPHYYQQNHPKFQFTPA